MFTIFSNNDEWTEQGEKEKLTFSTQSVSSCTIWENEWIKGKTQLPHICYENVQGDTTNIPTGERYNSYKSLDYNGDGKVDYLDQFLDLSCIINGAKECPSWKTCDIDGDGNIDAADYSLFGDYLHRWMRIEVCGDWVDNDEDANTADDCTPCEDKDNDEVCEIQDCDDNDASVGYANDYACVYFETNSSSCKTLYVCPSECADYTKNMQEVCGDNIDNDCDGTVDETACVAGENDSDNDGVDNNEDNCPDDSNANQQDSDDDGIGDVCDPTDDSSNDDINNTADKLTGYCGNNKRDIMLGEMCDGIATQSNYCSAGETCVNCICKKPETSTSIDTKTETKQATTQSSPPVCGSKNKTNFYDGAGDGAALTADMSGLCGAGEVKSFTYNTAGHIRSWKCVQGTKTVSCSADAWWCGDAITNGAEQCDDIGETSTCPSWQACNNLCVCFVESMDGVCGSKNKSNIYHGDVDNHKLSSTDPWLCEKGKILDFEYSESDYLRRWTCQWAWAGSDDECFAVQERCGDAITNGSEQCDDGNDAWWDGCSARCLGESTFHFGPVKDDGCGDANIDLWEQCDDGNLMDGDGCNSSCRVENGWKCTPTWPSQCGTIECYQHGERYTQYNIMWTCCGWLDTLWFEHAPEKMIAPGVHVFMCYDPDIGQPLCLPQENIAGWYIADEKNGPRKLITKDQCDEVYKDYYHFVAEDLDKEYAYCQYDDEQYDEVAFRDIAWTYEQKAIQALVDFCVVKGPGDGMKYYQAKRTITRAEFIKMLIKTLFIGYEYDVQSESKAFVWNTYFYDVENTDRFAQYVVKAHELNLLDSLIEADIYGRIYINPNRRMERSEIIKIIKKLDIGQRLEDDMLEKLLGVAKYPNRAAVSALLTRKFIDKFMEYFYFSGRNREYLENLALHMKGKRYADQYTLIVEQIDKLQEGKEVFDDILETNKDSDFSVFRAVKYLKNLLDMYSIQDANKYSTVSVEEHYTASEESTGADRSWENFGVYEKESVDPKEEEVSVEEEWISHEDDTESESPKGEDGEALRI